MAGCVLYVVHVSSEDSLHAIARARRAGQNVWGETCPQYLVIDEAQLEEPDLQGAKYVFTPPPRTENHRRALWRALDADILSVIATDHSPFSLAKKLSISDGDFSRIPNGAGGVEERLMITHEFGVRRGRMSLSRMVEILAANPARLFGLYPRKGTIAVGSDADLVIFDPMQPRTLTAGQLHSQCDYTLYEGLEVKGVPESVFVRGEPVIRDRELVAEPGYGRFIKRAPFSTRIPPSAERPSPAALV
jgi:dihydropyrimidinase